MDNETHQPVQELIDALGKFGLQNKQLALAEMEPSEQNVAIMRQIHWQESAAYTRNNTLNTLLFTINALYRHKSNTNT